VVKGALTGLMTAALGGGNACWKTALVASMHANSVSKAGATLEDLAGDITHYPPEDVKFEEKEAEKLAIEDGLKPGESREVRRIVRVNSAPNLLDGSVRPASQVSQFRLRSNPRPAFVLTQEITPSSSKVEASTSSENSGDIVEQTEIQEQIDDQLVTETTIKTIKVD
jgi:hypothetical protein